MSYAFIVGPFAGTETVERSLAGGGRTASCG